VLWDNNVVTDGNGGRALSPPGFPNIRVAEDIRVGGPGWIVDTLRAFIIEDRAWTDGGNIDVYVYNDASGQPGGLHTYWSGLSFTKTAGATYFGRAGYTYNINVGGMNLAPGNYWIGMRNPNGSGSGTNYWMTSDGGPDGAGTSFGYFSLDGGNSWMPEGSPYHHAFRIEGEFVPEPSAMLALGAGLAVLAARRSRR
jgi:hypothetical protein